MPTGRAIPHVLRPADRVKCRQIVSSRAPIWAHDGGVSTDMWLSLLAIAAPLGGALFLAVIIARDRGR